MRQSITVFCRVKPSKKEGKYEITGSPEKGAARLEIVVPKLTDEGHVNNKTELHRFKLRVLLKFFKTLKNFSPSIFTPDIGL